MLNAFDEAKDVLYANTLFIKKDFIDKYLGLLKLAGEQKFVFEQRQIVSNLRSDKGILETEDYKRSAELHSKLMELNDEIREYLASLDVLD